MNRLIELLLGLDRGFLSRDGEFAIDFNPLWPGGAPAAWNLGLATLAVALIVFVYRREGSRRPTRGLLAALRLTLFAVVLVLLNRPTVTLTQARVEPSVLAIAIDDSLSMRVADVGSGDRLQPRLDAVTKVLSADQAALVRKLAGTHQLKFYRFDADAAAVETSTTRPVPPIEPRGQSTRVAESVRSILRDLQGRRLAGVVVFTDGRDMPQAAASAAAIDAVKDYGTAVYPIPVGSGDAPRNIELQQVSVEDVVFAKEIANIRATVRVTGSTRPTVVRLLDKVTGRPVLDADGKPVQQTFTPTNGTAGEVDLLFTPAEPGVRQLIVAADAQPGEIDTDDNARDVRVTVLDSKINVLFVDGYPRWDYRYLKNTLIRDKTVDVSCLLMSADANFRQEGDRPITRFPDSPGEMLDYDVILIGDVDPRQLSDNQTQLIADFVARRGGGFGMVAGPLYSPAAWKGTPVEAVLPVDITKSVTEEWGTSASTIGEAFRPVVTKAGLESGLFRFRADRAENDAFLKNEWQPLFWYAKGLTPKPGVGEVLAEHPTDKTPDGRPMPILVAGRYGAGRTMFLGVDDSWRWRFYTGEHTFDTFWVQQLRYLARGRKLGQRRLTLIAGRSVYELGQQIRLTLRVIDPQLLTQLPPQLRVELTDADGRVVRQEPMVRQDNGDTYLGSFSADRVGKFTVKLPSPAPGVEDLTVPVEVAVPKLELSSPQVDRVALTRLAGETGGRVIELADAARQLPLIPSAERRVPVVSQQPIWTAPLALAAFAVVLTLEWVLRKWFGMV